MRSLLKILVLLTVSFSFALSASGGEGGSAENAGLSELRWRKTRIQVAFSTSLTRPHPAIRPDSDISGAIRRSLAVWEAAADIDFEIVWTDTLNVSPSGKSGDGINLVTIAQTPENLLLFGGEATDASARSRVFFNGRREISEADIVFNPYQQFSTDGSFGTFDFESVLTHELGHLLGLEHTDLPASTMFESQGKNGTFGMSSFGPRTLSDDDVSKVRGIYGKADEASCCGEIDGKLAFTVSAKDSPMLNVWLERAETGRVAAGTTTAADGSFRFRGLSFGKYRVYAQDAAGIYSGLDLGDVTVSARRLSPFLRKVELIKREFSVVETGFNGQLLKLPVLLNAGKNFLVYAGGKRLAATDLIVSTNAPGIAVRSVDGRSFEYGDDLSVISFEVSPSGATVNGDYTLTVRDASGGTQYLPALVTIESFRNPWISANFE